MNQQDRKEFEIVHLKMDEMKKDIADLKKKCVILIKRQTKI